MQNTPANMEIKQKIYELFLDYPTMDTDEVLAKLKIITEEVKKQNKEVKKNATRS